MSSAAIKHRMVVNDKRILRAFTESGFLQFMELDAKGILGTRQLRHRLTQCAHNGYLTQIAKRGLEKDDPRKSMKGLYLYEITQAGLKYRDEPTPEAPNKKKGSNTRVRHSGNDDVDDMSSQGTKVVEIQPGVKRVTNMYLSEAKRRELVDKHDVKDLVNSVFALGEAKHRKTK